jgi:hypothetical protein
MIAAALTEHAATLREQTLRQHRSTLRFHCTKMTNFLFDLFSNLALLAFVLAACHLCNRLMPDASLNGAGVFAVLALIALLLDTTLTFLVFADAQARYGQFSTPAAFFERAGSYILAIIVAFACRQIARRSRLAKPSTGEALVIHTSPYSKSHLPM